MSRVRSPRVLSLLALASTLLAAETQPRAAGQGAETSDTARLSSAEQPVELIARMGEFRVTEARLDRMPEAFTHLDAAPRATLQSRSLSDLLPGLQVNASGAMSFNDTVSLRGLSNTPIFGAAAVAVYVDDIPLGGTFMMPEDLSLLGTAELFYGPSQGSAFGRSAPAGLLQLGTGGNGASPRSFVGQFSSGSAGFLGGSAIWTSQGADKVRVGVAHSRRNGFVTNEGTGERIDNKDTWTGLARVRFRPLGGVRLQLTALLQRSLNGEQPMVPLFGDKFTVNRSATGRSDAFSANLGFTASYSAEGGSVSSTTSVNEWRLGPYLSLLSFGPMELLNDVSLRQRSFNEEIRFVSSKGSAGQSWSAGAFISDGVTRGAFTRAFGPMTYESSAYTIDHTQAVLFGEARSGSFADFSLGAGLRLEEVRARLERTERVPAPGNLQRVAQSGALLPRVTLNWDPAIGVHADLSLVTGYKPAGVSAFTGNEALTGFAAERLTGIELGVRPSSRSSRFNCFLRAHAYRISGYQIERSFATGAMTDDYLVVNAPRAESLGAEAGLDWSPAALPLLKFTAAAGLTKATLRDFTDPYSKQSYSGKRVPYAPVSDGSLSVEYGGSLGWFAAARASMKGRVHFTEGEDPTFSQASRTLISARTGYAWRQVRLCAYGENLSDRRYWSSIAPGTYHGTPGAPLTWGIEATVSF